MNKTSHVFDVSEAICDSFKLFKGKRTQPEDEQIFLKVLEHCLRKLLSLVGDKLDKKYAAGYAHEISEIEKIDNQDEQIKKLQNLFSRLAGKANLKPQKVRCEMRQTIDDVLRKSISNRLKK